MDWYDVELIVFRHHDYKALNREKWTRDPGSPMIRTARELLPALPVKLSAAHSEKLKVPIAFIQLHEDLNRMKRKLKQLQKSSRYEPLIHLSWRQPGLGPDDAEAVHVHGGVNGTIDAKNLAISPSTPQADEVEGPPAPLIDGTIKLIRKRFLHVEADFLYRAPFIEDKGNLLAHKQWPQAFRLQESRRMRSREIHYLDHPMFGVLILASPYEAPVDEALGVEGMQKKLGGLTPPSNADPLNGAIRR